MVVTNPTVNVRLTSTISSFEVQRRFNRGISIAELKASHIFLEIITPKNMDMLPPLPLITGYSVVAFFFLRPVIPIIKIVQHVL